MILASTNHLTSLKDNEHRGGRAFSSLALTLDGEKLHLCSSIPALQWTAAAHAIKIVYCKVQQNI